MKLNIVLILFYCSAIFSMEKKELTFLHCTYSLDYTIKSSQNIKKIAVEKDNIFAAAGNKIKIWKIRKDLAAKSQDDTFEWVINQPVRQDTAECNIVEHDTSIRDFTLNKHYMSTIQKNNTITIYNHKLQVESTIKPKDIITRLLLQGHELIMGSQQGTLGWYNIKNKTLHIKPEQLPPLSHIFKHQKQIHTLHKGNIMCGWQNNKHDLQPILIPLPFVAKDPMLHIVQHPQDKNQLIGALQKTDYLCIFNLTTKSHLFTGVLGESLRNITALITTPQKLIVVAHNNRSISIFDPITSSLLTSWKVYKGTKITSLAGTPNKLYIGGKYHNKGIIYIYSYMLTQKIANDYPEHELDQIATLYETD